MITAQRLKGAAIGFVIAAAVLILDRCMAGVLQCDAAGTCPW
ncbi:hypothetical protein [Pelagerythrobacter sp.]